LPTSEQQATLAARVGSGDPEAEDEFARAYGPRVFALILARLRDREAARELANDALMAALRALRDGRVRETDRLAAFVAGVARNVANSFLRERSRRPLEAVVDLDTIARDDAPSSTPAERVVEARRRIGQLEDVDREVLTLVLCEGLKPTEIATRLGLSGEVVRARKSRALKRLLADADAPSRTGPGDPL
jgi:RNA polymerase sigma-70 factor (ECF subfamily)